jgi:hypothetical protein
MGIPRNVILHYHIFKNAGSTLCTALERNFGRNFAQLHSPRHDQRLSGEALLEFVHAQPEVAAISSHHLSPPAPTSDSVRFQEILIIRDPLDRIRSMYDFYRRSRINNDPLTMEAKQFSLPEFLEYVLETRPFLLINSQTNVVANAGTKIPSEDDLSRAVAILRATAVVGVVENYDLCVLLAEHALRPLFPELDLSYVRKNVTPSRAKDLQSRLHQFRSDCGDKLFTKLVESNRLDMDLAAAARSESARRWQEIKTRRGELRKFKIRVHQRRIVRTVVNQLLRLRSLYGRATRRFSPQQ